MSDDLVSSRTADLSKKYILGRDGWIFLDKDSNHVLDQCRGVQTLDAAGVQAWIDLFEARRRYCMSIGAVHAVLIAPNKEVVYAEQLPEILPISEARPVRRIEAMLRAAGLPPLLYPLEALRSKAVSGIVYPRTDTHWSGFGASIAYRELLEFLNGQGMSVAQVAAERLSFATVETVGDLGVKLDPTVASPTLSTRIDRPRGRLVFDNHIPNRGRTRVFVNADSSLPRCIMFGDSFGGNLLALLKESFSILVYVYGKAFDQELIEAYQPDVVLTQIVERFLIDPPVPDQSTFTYLSVIADKLKLLSALERRAFEASAEDLDPTFHPLAADYRALFAVTLQRPIPALLVDKLAARPMRNAETSFLLSVEHLRRGDLPAALEFVGSAVAANPTRAKFQHHLALIHLRMGQPAAAEAALLNAIRLDPAVIWWSYQLAQAQFRQDKFAAARATAQSYLVRSPQAADGWQLLGRCLEALGDMDEAVLALWRAADARPGWRWPLLKLGNLCFKQRLRLEDALIAVDRLIVLPATPRQIAEAWLLRSQLLNLQSRRAEALASAEQASIADPDWSWARLQHQSMARAA